MKSSNFNECHKLCTYKLLVSTCASIIHEMEIIGTSDYFHMLTCYPWPMSRCWIFSEVPTISYLFWKFWLFLCWGWIFSEVPTISNLFWKFTFLTVPLFFNATFEQTSRETVGTSKRVARTKIHILLQSVYIRKNRHKKGL